MNIVYLNHYAGSPEMGMEFRPYYLAKEWKKLGHNVYIIAGDYSHLRKKNPIVTHEMQSHEIDGIKYYWLKTGEYHGNGIKRAFSMLKFCYKIFLYRNWINNNLNPDVIISSSTYPIDSIPAYRVAKQGVKKSKHIHEVHDMWPSTLVEIGGMSRLNPFVMLMQYGENYAYKHADAVVSLPKYAKEYMMKHGLDPKHFYYLPNGIVKEEWEKPEQLPEEHQITLKKLKEDNKFVVGYFGGHALSNCLMTLINAAQEIDADNVHFVLVGSGVEKEQLMEAAKGLTNVSFLPPINKRAIPALTEYFDCTYIGAKDSTLYRFGACMNKMFDGMMAGKPIIFAINAPITPVQECDCGVIIRPEDPKAIISAIRSLIDMGKEKREKMGQRGKQEVLNKYTYEILGTQFAEIMTENN